MKKFLSKSVLFFLTLLLAAVLVECSVRDNTFKAKRDYIEANSDEIEVMILGSSQSFRAINPEFLSMKTAPLAHGGSAINMDFKLFDKYYRSFPKLKVVMVEISYHTLDESRNHNWNKNHLFSIYYDVNNYKHRPPLRDHLLLTANFHEYLKKFYKETFTSEAQEFNEFGYPFKWMEGSRFSDLQYNDSLILKTSRTEYLNGRHWDEHLSKFKTNTQKLDELIATCSNNGIEVVLLSPPKFYLYNEYMNEKKLKRRDSIFAKYRDHKNVHIWNFEAAYENETKLFGNEDHMNPEGAALFTKELNRLLEPLIDSH
jgi:hypothetical protein